MRVTGEHVARDSQPSPATTITVCAPHLKLLSSTYSVLITSARIIQDGWRRLEYEKVLAPAPAEESGAGLARREESCTFCAHSPACVTHDHRVSSRRRRNLTNSGRRRKRNDSSKNFNAFKRNKQGRNGRRNWNGCILHRRRGAGLQQTILRTICWGRKGLIRSLRGTRMTR